MRESVIYIYKNQHEQMFREKFIIRKTFQKHNYNHYS